MKPTDSRISSITTGPRQSNMELLRIVAMLMVLLLHANGLSNGTPDLTQLSTHTASALTRIFFQALCIVSVNVFVLISGWFGIRPSAKGFLNFIFQCLFFSCGIYLVMVAAGLAPISGHGLASCLLLTSDCWFVKSYILLYILSPLLNKFIETSSLRLHASVIAFFFIFQTLYGWIGNTAFIAGGYSTTSFIGLYLLASFTHKYLYNSILYKLGGGDFYNFAGPQLRPKPSDTVAWHRH